MEQWLISMCERLRDVFLRCFGDEQDTQGEDRVLPATADWQLVCSMSLPCLLILKNTDAANEMMFTWNKNNAVGFRLSFGDTVILDNVSGALYAKSSTGLVTVNMNYLAISLKVH